VEAPVVLGDGLGEIGFESPYGGEGFADAIAVLVEGFLVFRGVDDDLAGESVAEGVEERFFPSVVRGLVESWAFLRRAVSCASVIELKGSFVETIPAKEAITQ
jgi:hypothetical protein